MKQNRVPKASALLTMEASDMSNGWKTMVILRLDSQSLTHARASCYDPSNPLLPSARTHTPTDTQLLHTLSHGCRTSSKNSRVKITNASKDLLDFVHETQGSWPVGPVMRGKSDQLSLPACITEWDGPNVMATGESCLIVWKEEREVWPQMVTCEEGGAIRHILEPQRCQLIVWMKTSLL